MLKKLLIIPAFFATTAQVPLSTVTIGFDAVPTATGYTITVDGVTKDVGNPPLNPSCTCPSVTLPMVPATSHRITVTAYTATLTSPASVPLVLPPTCSSGRALSDCWAVTPSVTPWALSNIGFVNPLGTAAVTGAQFTLSAGGLALGGAQDGLFFVHQASSGTGSISARVLSVSAGMAGLEWREDLTSVPRHVAVGLLAGGGAQLVVRTTQGAAGRVLATVPGVSAPAWLRLTRGSGNVFTASSSIDGVTWAVVGTMTLPMPVGTRVGIFTLGASSTVANIVQIDSVSKLP